MSAEAKGVFESRLASRRGLKNTLTRRDGMPCLFAEAPFQRGGALYYGYEKQPGPSLVGSSWHVIRTNRHRGSCGYANSAQ